MIGAVLLDRDGTLIADDAARRGAIEYMPFALEALQQLRERHVRLAVISNEARALDARIQSEAGPFDGWFVCTHAENVPCECRKPRPGLILRALEQLGVRSDECAIIGDIGSDMEAANAAGAHAILVPTPVTRPEEIAAAPFVCDHLRDAARAVLDGRIAELVR